MPRRARVVIPYIAHHVVQRGNYQQQVFDNNQDFRTYLYLITANAPKFELQIHAYCLMHNHVHFIITPSDQIGLSDFFKAVHTRYSQYKNLQKQRMGHLWQGRFYSCVLDDAHLMQAMRYVEMNPVRAHMVKRPWTYIWSSARQHMLLEKHPLVSTVFPGPCQEEGWNARNWKDYLLEEDNRAVASIRDKTRKGLAVGERGFIEDLEQRWGVVLRQKKVGRPRLMHK